MKIWVKYYLLLILLSGCARLPAPEIPEISGISSAHITRTVLLPHVSSGSSLSRDGQTLYLVSDDAPYVYTYSLKTGETDSVLLPYLESRAHRMSHPQKADYEASFITEHKGEKYLILFGSGSRSPTRDFVGIFPLDKSKIPERRDAAALYKRLRISGNLALKDFNLEGATRTSDGTILLLNRGRQQYFQVSENDLWAWIENGTLLAVSVQSTPLPGAAPYTFSGAETLDKTTLVFAASQEATKSAQSDGEVVGSAIGFLHKTNDNTWQVKGFWPVKDASGKPAREKIEGVIPNPAAQNFRKFIALTDNDDGQSKLLWIELR